jgi:septum formation protein
LEWPAIAGCVGCFRIEGPGVQLFSHTEGDHFTILGMPLLPVLDYLRVRKVMPA